MSMFKFCIAGDTYFVHAHAHAHVHAHTQIHNHIRDSKNQLQGSTDPYDFVASDWPSDSSNSKPAPTPPTPLPTSHPPLPTTPLQMDSHHQNERKVHRQNRKTARLRHSQGRHSAQVCGWVVFWFSGFLVCCCLLTVVC